MILVIFSVLMLNIRNFGQKFQVDVSHAYSDIAAEQENVYLLQSNMIKKLNSQLEVVKTVTLPPENVMIPPIPEKRPATELNEPSSAIKNPNMPLQPGVPGPSAQGRICTDSRNVYVLYEDSIIVFDLDLNFVKSRDMAGANN